MLNLRLLIKSGKVPGDAIFNRIYSRRIQFAAPKNTKAAFLKRETDFLIRTGFIFILAQDNQTDALW